MKELLERNKMFQTEFEFQLPKGYFDEKGVLHQYGKMRLATAKDELEAMKHPKARYNNDYVSIVVLSKVITQLGTYNEVTLEMVERLFTIDLNFLQEFYQCINENGTFEIHVTCPHCGKSFVDTPNFHSQE